MKVSVERLVRDLSTLAEIGRTPQGGITRLPFTQADMDARRMLMKWMIEAGLTVSVDQAGNVVGIRPGTSTSAPAVMIGSHIDTVINAGAYDGALGVMTGLEVARTLNDNKIQTTAPIILVSFTNEEGVRFPPLIGSKAIAGELTPQEIYDLKSKDGISFREAMEQAGMEIEKLVPPLKSSKIGAYLELHIEQGPTLEAENCDIGIVNSIVGLIILELHLTGKAGHAGTTPMKSRRDALYAAAQIIVKVREIVSDFSDGSVATVGSVDVFPNASNVISERVHMTVDMRSSNKESLLRLYERISEIIRQTRDATDVEVEIKERARSDPIAMNEQISRKIIEVSRRNGFRYKTLHSGAGHDAMVIAKVAKSGMIFVPCKGGISHSPEEFCEPKDIEAGADVLLGTTLALAEVSH